MLGPDPGRRPPLSAADVPTPEAARQVMRETLAEAAESIRNLVTVARETGCANGFGGGCGYCTLCRINQVLELTR